jgi:hypothetical protein
MNSTFPTNVARTAGVILGLGIALAIVVTSLPSAGGSPLPATARFSVVPVGEFEVTPPAPGPVLVADPLLPGARPATGAFSLRNQTGDRLAVHLTASADSTSLDGLLRVRISADGHPLADTTLQGLKQRGVRLDLASGVSADVKLTAWIPAEVTTGYEGRLVRVSLTPTVDALPR